MASASSWGTSASPATGAARAAGDAAAGMATMLAHEGHTWVDTVAGKQILTHELLLKRWELPENGGPWHLVFVEGFGSLVSDQTDRVIFLEEWMPEQVWVEHGERFLVEHIELGGKVEKQRSSLDALLRQHACREAITVVDGDDKVVEVFTLARSRCASRVAWSCFSVYGLLELTSYKGVRSKWTYNSFAAWDAILTPCGLRQSVVKSFKGMSAEDALAECDAILRTPGVMTPGLIVLLYRWVGASSRRGGLRDANSQTKAASVLKAMLATSYVNAFQIDIALDMDHQFRWPRPDADCDRKVRLDVDANGRVDLREWLQMHRDHELFGVDYSPVAQTWFNVIKPFVSEDGSANFVDFFCYRGLANRPEYDGMVLQLAKAVGHRVERAFFQSLREPECEFPVRYHHDKNDTDDWSCRAVDRVCMEHVFATRFVSKGIKMIGLASDKYSGRNVELLNGCFVLPSGVAFEAVPQVLQGSKGLGYGRLRAELSPPRNPESFINIQKLCLNS